MQTPIKSVVEQGGNEMQIRPDINTLRTGDADLRFYVTTVQDE